MKLVRTIAEVRSALPSGEIGLVPTAGAVANALCAETASVLRTATAAPITQNFFIVRSPEEVSEMFNRASQGEGPVYATRMPSGHGAATDVRAIHRKITQGRGKISGGAGWSDLGD